VTDFAHIFAVENLVLFLFFFFFFFFDFLSSSSNASSPSSSHDHVHSRHFPSAPTPANRNTVSSYSSLNADANSRGWTFPAIPGD
jgi:hypothetical protein